LNEVDEIGGDVHCGCDVLQFDAGDKRWERLASKRIPGGWIGSCRATGLAGRIYLVAWGSANGGPKGQGMTVTFDVQTKEWANLAPTVVRRSQHALTVCNGYVYVVGGVGPASETCERYDPETDTWQVIQAALDRFNVAAAECDGRLIAVGGFGPRSMKGVTVERISTGMEEGSAGSRWIRGGLPPLTEGRIHPALVPMSFCQRGELGQMRLSDETDTTDREFSESEPGSTATSPFPSPVLPSVTMPGTTGTAVGRVPSFDLWLGPGEPPRAGSIDEDLEAEGMPGPSVADSGWKQVRPPAAARGRRDAGREPRR